MKDPWSCLHLPLPPPAANSALPYQLSEGWRLPGIKALHGAG